MDRAAGVVRAARGLIPIFGWLVHWNAVMRAQRGDTLTCPAVAMTRDEAIPVEDAGDDIIIGDQHELANSGNHIGCGAVALTAAASGQTISLWTLSAFSQLSSPRRAFS
jgi:hypothetical protein